MENLVVALEVRAVASCLKPLNEYHSPASPLELLHWGHRRKSVSFWRQLSQDLHVSTTAKVQIFLLIDERIV